MSLATSIHQQRPVRVGCYLVGVLALVQLFYWLAGLLEVRALVSSKTRKAPWFMRINVYTLAIPVVLCVP